MQANDAVLDEALEHGSAVRVPLAAFEGPALLRRLADRRATYHVRVESGTALLEIEIGSGVVTGARARERGALVEGDAALARLATMGAGSARVEPRRFLSMANVLSPLLAPESPPRAPLEARTPAEARELRRPDAPVCAELDPPAPGLPRERPPPDERPEPATRNRRAPWLVAACVITMAAAGVAFAVYHTEYITVEAPARRITVAPLPARARAPVEPAPARSAERGATTLEPSARAHAAALAARRSLEAGEYGAALDEARLAARLRPGIVSYQLLLGDALAANGRPAAALRAWTRAARLSPGQPPALRRLMRASSAPLASPQAPRRAAARG